MDEEDKIALVLEKAPKDYSGILAAEEREKGDALTAEDLEKAMKIHYHIKYHDTEVQGEGDELA
eukprot:2534712-Ditylum_brightwellii.AAC.1